jgi:hypothetical protein
MNNTIDAPPNEVVVQIDRVLETAVPSAQDLAAADRQYRQHNAARDREKVIECYYRCQITEYLQRRFALSADAVPGCINSSHKATRCVCVAQPVHEHKKISEAAWEAGWQSIRRNYPKVDMYVRTAESDHSLRRADLYVIAAEQIVSLEFKYIGSEGLVNPRAISKQVQVFLQNHAATRLIIYSGTPHRTVISRLQPLLDMLPCAVPVVLYGPAV